MCTFAVHGGSVGGLEKVHLNLIIRSRITFLAVIDGIISHAETIELDTGSSIRIVYHKQYNDRQLQKCYYGMEFVRQNGRKLYLQYVLSMLVWGKRTNDNG